MANASGRCGHAVDSRGSRFPPPTTPGPSRTSLRCSHGHLLRTKVAFICFYLFIYTATADTRQEPSLCRPRERGRYRSSGHPSLPDPREGAACRAGSVLLLTHLTLAFLSFLPSSLELRGRSAAMAAVPPPRRESTAERELADDQTATGDWRARPLPSLPGGEGRAETKAPVRCHSCRRVRLQLEPGVQPPPKKDSLWCPRCGHQGVQTPHASAADVTQPR